MIQHKAGAGGSSRPVGGMKADFYLRVTGRGRGEYVARCVCCRCMVYRRETGLLRGIPAERSVTYLVCPCCGQGQCMEIDECAARQQAQKEHRF